MKSWFKYIFASLAFLNAGCSDIIEYSPYSASVSAEHINDNNIKCLSNSEDDTVSFIAISDSHGFYDDLKAAVDYINTRSEVDFVVMCGDITDSGLAKEFEWYRQIIMSLKVPIITLLGNHDYNSNGATIYKKMFGPSNFYFDYGKFRFIGFDDVVWENNNATPHFDWLRAVLENVKTEVRPAVLFAHIPSWNDQLTGAKSREMESIIQDSPVVLCMHGHHHNYEYREHDNIKYVVTGSVSNRELSLVQMHDDTLVLKRLSF